MKDGKFYLMCKDKEIAEFNISHDIASNIVVLNRDLLPEMLKINNSIALHEWLKSRSIDISRLLLKLLKLSQYKYINKLQLNLIDYIDRKVKYQIGNNINGEGIKNHFVEVLSLLK